MVNFPCPKKDSEFKQVEGGYYCNDCDEILIDLSNSSIEEVNHTKKSHEGACVVLKEKDAEVPIYSFKRFALSLIIVMGTTGFVFSNNQLENSLNDVREVFLSDSVAVNNVSVSVTHKDGRLSYGWVKVIFENDSIETLEMNKGEHFSIHLGEEHRGESIRIEVSPYKGRTKKEVIKDFDPDSFYHFNFEFADRQYRRIIRGKF